MTRERTRQVATIAVAQTDIKKVLAYSTVSQLGFMFIGVGCGAWWAGILHLVTHAFFKACLFLGAGSVIHAMHRALPHEADPQDIRNMGGLRSHMPLTYWTFLVATLAIAIVWLPLFQLSGVSGWLFTPMAEAVIFAMLASFILSFTLLPTMAKYMMKSHHVAGA